MPLAQDDDVFEHLSTTATDPALSGSVLPWAAKRRAHRPRSHRLDEFDDGRAEDGVAVEDEISRRRVVGKRVTQLLEHPRRRWMESCVEVNAMPTTVLDNEEAVQQSERRGWHGEQNHRGDIVLVVAQERYPSLHLALVVFGCVRHKPGG